MLLDRGRASRLSAPIQYNQVIPGDHLTDQDPPPVQTNFSLLGRLTIEVARNKGVPTSLCEAFLKKEDLGLKDLEKVVGSEVAAVHTYPRHFHPKEPRVGLQEISDAQIRASNKDPSPPGCILVPSKVFGPFVLLTNEQYIGPPLPGNLHQKVLGFLPSLKVEL